MKVIKPVTLTGATLISSNATETDAEYNAGTAYALNAQSTLASTGRTYKCIQGPSTGNTPNTSPLYWTDIGPSNKWAMLDNQISTQTSRASDITLVLAPGYINSLALFGLEGNSLTVTVRDGIAGPVVYSYSQTLDGTLIADWYQYYFEPSVQLTEVVLTNLPPYGSAHITITISGAGTVKCGHLAVGTVYGLGDTEYGAQASITDYSRKDTDAFGITTFTRRNYSRRMSARLMLDNGQLNKVRQVLADLRATPCAWVGSDAAGYEALTVFGFYRDFSVDVSYPTKSYCSLEIEGLA